MSTADELPFDRARLATWLRTQGLIPESAELTVHSLVGGASNEIYLLNAGDVSLVLRKPPGHAIAERSPTMLREARVLAALNQTGVPHPRLMAVHQEPDLVGSAFYLMGHVDGWSPASEGPRGPQPFDTDLEARGSLGSAIVAGIAELATVDWQQVGLGDFGRPEGFHDRQVSRWMSHLSGFTFRDIPGLDDAATWLSSHRPREWRPGIIHGDYSFANVMFGHERPGRLAAIVDWEMSTIGDPLLDLGWLLMRWPSPEGPRPRGSFDMDGMPSQDEVLELYTSISGRPVDDIDYYRILAYFKNAIVLEGGYARYVAGTADNPKMALFGDMVLEMAALAGRLSHESRLPEAR